MKKILDYSWSRPGGKSIKKAGYVGVMRYLSYTVGKNLSATELKDLEGNGLAVGLVWESTAQSPLGGLKQGVSDAKEAVKQATALGFVSTPIYFAVDFSPTNPQLEIIAEYFKGCASIVGKEKLGAYGSYYVMMMCQKKDLVSYYWQTLAWSGGKKAAFIHIYQNGQKVDIAGTDINEVWKDDWNGIENPAISAPEIPQIDNTPLEPQTPLESQENTKITQPTEPVQVFTATTVPDYQDLIDPENQLKQMVGDLWDWIISILNRIFN